MSAQLVQRRVVVFVKRQGSILYVAHQQAAPFEVPADAFTEAANEREPRSSTAFRHGDVKVMIRRLLGSRCGNDALRVR